MSTRSSLQGHRNDDINHPKNPGATRHPFWFKINDAAHPCLRDAETAGSNPAIPTNKIKGLPTKIGKPFFWVIRIGHKRFF